MIELWRTQLTTVDHSVAESFTTTLFTLFCSKPSMHIHMTSSTLMVQQVVLTKTSFHKYMLVCTYFSSYYASLYCRGQKPFSHEGQLHNMWMHSGLHWPISGSTTYTPQTAPSLPSQSVQPVSNLSICVHWSAMPQARQSLHTWDQGPMYPKIKHLKMWKLSFLPVRSSY